MAKYLVIADTYNRPYGREYTLFGIFDSQEEAVKWIIDNPVVYTAAPDEEEGYEGETFNFFETYDEEHGGVLRTNRRSMWGEQYIQMTKEEYIGCRGYIHLFNGEPMYIGGYCE